LIVKWRAIPNRWKFVAPPLVLVAAIFFGWFLLAGLLIEAVDPVQAVHAERFEALRPIPDRHHLPGRAGRHR
jgi:hypothetical protein